MTRLSVNIIKLLPSAMPEAEIRPTYWKLPLTAKSLEHKALLFTPGLMKGISGTVMYGKSGL